MSYGSARDLPSIKEMEQQLAALRFFSFLVPKKQRVEIKELPVTLAYITTTVDDFYWLLGPRHWVFHDDLSVDDMANLVHDHRDDMEGAERALIEWYQGDRLPNMVRRLHGLPEMRARMDLLLLALDDYGAGRYYATVQVLLSVMDGFVNDVDKTRRQGLHARDAEEMDAWDSVVGHHLGLSAAQKTFTRSFKARSDEPVHDLYRHGIVHGMLTNYNNVIVATKAFNRLFAVADWARSLAAQKKNMEKRPSLTWREVAEHLRTNSQNKAALAEFSPTTLSAGDSALPEHEVYAAMTAFCESWQGNNYGAMATSITRAWQGVSPSEVKQDYRGHVLTGHEIVSLSHSALVVCTILVRLQVDGREHTTELRWVREGPDGRTAMPQQPGEWRLMWWGLSYMTRDAE